MSQLAKLKAAASRHDLASILGYSPASLTAIIYKIPQQAKYTTFEIDKKSGGKRIIKAPVPKLKTLQSHLSNVLYQCLEAIDRDRGMRPIAFGFRRKQTIMDNAACHKRHRWILNIDLKDFFPTFNFGRVRGFFLKDKAFQLQPEVATTIAQIACDGVALPQGSPSSPVIAELIAQILDMRLIRLAKKYKVTYSRYADDITFSTNQKLFPHGLAKVDPNNPEICSLGEELVDKIVGAGFVINSKKTRIHFRGSRQMVTGLIVNEKVNIRREYYKNARAMCSSLYETGQYFKSITLSNGKLIPDKTSNLNPLEGILSHIYTVTQYEDKRYIKQQQPRAIRKIYKKFLFYKYFLALDKPLIITEGKTDPIYLREAIKKLSQFHPVLGAKGAKDFVHAVKYFHYTGLADEILGLGGGGSANLKTILMNYKDFLHSTKKGLRAIIHHPMKHPVIIVLDNDGGLTPVAKVANQNFNVSFSTETTSDFYHITDNLYVIKTPEIGKMSCIEDLFPDEIREKKLKGKSFNPSDKIDNKTEYGKNFFAEYVVHPSADKIDFSGFSPLLERICKVITDYSTNILKI